MVRLPGVNSGRRTRCGSRGPKRTSTFADGNWPEGSGGRLSADRTVACSTCHDPARSFTDGRPTSVDIQGRVGERNAPTVPNALFNTTQFWDGAATGQMRPWARNRLDPNCPASDLFRQEITIALCSSSRERGPNNAGLAPRHSSRCYYMRCEEPCACRCVR